MIFFFPYNPPPPIPTTPPPTLESLRNIQCAVGFTICTCVRPIRQSQSNFNWLQSKLLNSNPEGRARHLNGSRRKLTPHCLAAIFDSQLPSPKLSDKMPPKLPLPHKGPLKLWDHNPQNLPLNPLKKTNFHRLKSNILRSKRTLEVCKSKCNFHLEWCNLHLDHWSRGAN